MDVVCIKIVWNTVCFFLSLKHFNFFLLTKIEREQISLIKLNVTLVVYFMWMSTVLNKKLQVTSRRQTVRPCEWHFRISVCKLTGTISWDNNKTFSVYFWKKNTTTTYNNKQTATTKHWNEE